MSVQLKARRNKKKKSGTHLIRGDSAQLKQGRKSIRKQDRGGFGDVVGQLGEPEEKS